MPLPRHILMFKIFLMKIYRLKVCFSLIALWVAFDGYSQKSELDPYVDFLRRQNTSAVDYVFELFEKYDIVILGERDHRDITQYQFINEIISDRRFIQNVGHIFTEVGVHNQTERANEILANKYDDYSVFERDLMRLYRDLNYWSVWEKYNFWYLLSTIYHINASLDDTRKLTIHFTDIPFDWDNYFDAEAYAEVHDRDSIMGNNFIDDFDKIRQNPNEPRKKALVIMNTRHSFKDHPKAVWRKSAASVIFDRYPGSVANVMINNTTLTEIVDDPDHLIERGKWDAAFKYVDNPELGFDMADSPFGEDILQFYEQPSAVEYKEVFTGFVFYKPISEWILMLGIPGFVDEEFKPEFIRRCKLSRPDAETEDILSSDIRYCNSLRIRDHFQGNDVSREQVERWINYWLQ